MRKIGLFFLCLILSLALNSSADAMMRRSQMQSSEYEEQKQNIQTNRHVEAENYQTAGDAVLALKKYDDAAEYYLTSAKYVWENEELKDFFDKVGFRCHLKDLSNQQKLKIKAIELSKALQKKFGSK